MSVDDLVFELESFLMNAHLTFSFSGDRRVLRQARAAIRRRLGRG